MVRKYKTKSQRQRQRKTQKRRGNRKNKLRQNKKKINRTRRRYRGGTNIDWGSYFADPHIVEVDINDKHKQVLMNQERILKDNNIELVKFIDHINKRNIPVFGRDESIITWVTLGTGQGESQSQYPISNFSNNNNNNNNNEHN